MTPTHCDRCGVPLAIGDFPFCPHGRAGTNARLTDEAFIGGVTIENLGHDPVTVYSRQELRAAMRRANVEQRIRYVPGDRYLTNWAAGIDAYTLEQARILVSRSSARPASSHDGALETLRTSLRTIVNPQES